MIPQVPDALELQRDALFHQPNPLVFTIKEANYHLVRLTADAYLRLVKHSIAIGHEHSYYLWYRFPRSPDDLLTLAEAYLALKTRFGESCPLHDQYKGSFLFPFFLRIDKQTEPDTTQMFPYLFIARDYKGNLEFTLRRIIEPTDRKIRREIVHEPFENEFAKREISFFYAYFYGFLEGYGKTVLQQHNVFFFHEIQATLSLYGYADGTFFHHSYETTDDYEDAVAEFRQQQHQIAIKRRQTEQH